MFIQKIMLPAVEKFWHLQQGEKKTKSYLSSIFLLLLFSSGAAKLQKKRALSALSRWKPLGSLGIRMKAVHRTSSRAPMISMVPEMNLISPESEEGLRPLGQPLRWGRKR